MSLKTVGACRHRRAWRGRSAAETLELAFALPLLLVLAFGTVEFGYWFYLEHNFQAAAREGARAYVAAKWGNDMLARQQAGDDAARAILTDQMHIPEDKYQPNSVFEDTDGDNIPDYVTFTVEADWKDIGVETGLFMGASPGGRGDQTELVKENAKISGKVTMRIEM